MQNLPQKRLSGIQLVFPQDPTTVKTFGKDERDVAKLLSKAINRSINIKDFEGFGVGRGAGSAASGIDITEAFRIFGQGKELIEYLMAFVWVTDQLRKLKKKRRIIYSVQYIEQYCIGKILAKTKEEYLGKTNFIDLTGGNSEQYDYGDYYLFVFSGSDNIYIILVNCFAEVMHCEMIQRYKLKTRELKLD